MKSSNTFVKFFFWKVRMDSFRVHCRQSQAVVCWNSWDEFLHYSLSLLLCLSPFPSLGLLLYGSSLTMQFLMHYCHKMSFFFFFFFFLPCHFLATFHLLFKTKVVKFSYVAHKYFNYQICNLEATKSLSSFSAFQSLGNFVLESHALVKASSLVISFAQCHGIVI